MNDLSDRELLEWAARAVGISGPVGEMLGGGHYIASKDAQLGMWCPLADDGDRYRLLRDLKMHVDFDSQMVMCGEVVVRWPEDELNAERAIVRAAASIGKAKELE